MFPNGVIQKFLNLLALFSVFFAPLLFFTSAHDQFELPKLTFLFLLAVPALLLGLKRKVLFVPTPLSVALIFLFLVEAAASLPAMSLSWRASLLGDYENFSGLTTFALYLVWFLIFSGNPDRKKTLQLFHANSLAALLSSAYAIAQHFGFDFIQWNPESVNATREFASLGNPNFLAAFLAMSVPLFLCVALGFPGENGGAGEEGTPPGILWTFWALLGLLFLILGTGKGCSKLHLKLSTDVQFISRSLGLLILSTVLNRLLLFKNWLSSLVGLTILGLGLFYTGSRGGFLGMVFGCLLWVLLVLPEKGFHPLRDQVFPRISKIPAAIAGLGGLVLLLVLGRGFLIRLANSVLHPGQSLGISRLHIWGPAIQMAKANPALGVGLDNFKIAFPHYSGIEFNQIDGMFMSSRMAHNELLQMVSTTGFLGLAAYVGVLGAFIFMGWKAYQSPNLLNRWILAAVFASALAYHVQNFFSFGVAALNLVWFLLLAVVQSSYRRATPPPLSPPFALKAYGATQKSVAVFLSVLIFWFPLDRLGADVAFGKSGVFSEILKNPDPQTPVSVLAYYSDTQIGLLKKAVSLCPLEVKYVLYLGLAYEQRSQLDLGNQANWNKKALGCYEQAVQMSPANAYYYNDEGRVYEHLGASDPKNLEKAEGAYQTAVQWNPSSPFFNLNWSEMLRRNGKEKEADIHLAKAFELDPNFSARVLWQKAIESYRVGEKKSAFQYLAEAIHGDTTNAEAYYCRGVLHMSEAEEKKKNGASLLEVKAEKKMALADFEMVKTLDQPPEKNPFIRNLDQLMDQARH